MQRMPRIHRHKGGHISGCCLLSESLANSHRHFDPDFSRIEIPCHLISLKGISHPALLCFMSGEAEAGFEMTGA